MRKIMIVLMVFFVVCFQGCFSETYNDYVYDSMNKTQNAFILPMKKAEIFDVDCSKAGDPGLCAQELRILKKTNEDITEMLDRYKKYQEIVDNSPVPVIVMDRKEFKKNYLDKIDPKERTYFGKDDFNGIWIPRVKISGWPRQLIFIHDNKFPDYMIGTYFHEIGHYSCSRGLCSCLFEENGVLSEVHAHEHALIMLQMYGFDEALGLAIKSFEMTVLSDRASDMNKESIMQVFKRPMFENVMRYLVDKE